MEGGRRPGKDLLCLNYPVSVLFPEPASPVCAAARVAVVVIRAAFVLVAYSAASVFMAWKA